MARGHGWRGAGRAAIGWLVALAAVAGLVAFAGPWGSDLASAGGKGVETHGHHDGGYHHHLQHPKKPERVVVPADQVDVSFRHRDDDRYRKPGHDHHDTDPDGGYDRDGRHDPDGGYDHDGGYDRDGRHGHDGRHPKRHHRHAPHEVTYRVLATNIGAFTYEGPVILVIDQLERHAHVHEACGHLKDGRPYVCLQRTGPWGPGDTTPKAYLRIKDDRSGHRHHHHVHFLWHVEAVPVEGPVNAAPVADAGPDQTVLTGATATLDGSGSTDPDGDSLTYAWAFDTVPDGSAAALSDPAAVNPSFVVDVPGTYTVVLVVNDGQADSAPDSVAVTTVNTAPVADAGPDQTAFVTDTVTLDGTGSSDVDGDALTFDWTLVSVPDGSAAELSDPTAVAPTFVVDLPGTYEVELVVSDGLEDSAPDTVVVTTENSAPLANAGPDQTVPVGAEVPLDGSGSFDVDGDSLLYFWSIESAPEGSEAVLSDPEAEAPSFVADLPGTYVVQLIVNDGLADSEPDTAVIDTENSRPVADAGPDRAAQVGESVTLDGTGSSDPDGDGLLFAWSITTRPEGSAADLDDPTSPTPAFTPDAAGDYLVQLIVSDGALDSDPDTAMVVVSAAPVESQLSIDDVSLPEGDTESVDAVFTVTLSPAAATDVTVDFATADATATEADGDYVPVSGTLTIPAGETTGTIIVPVNGDLTVEPDETFFVNLANPSGATLADDQGVGTITNDDAADLVIDDVTLAEGDTGTTAFVFTISQSNPSSTDVTVDFATADGTATTADGDYVAASGTATISAGTQSTTVTVDVNGDVIVEPDEAFFVNLTNPSGATLADDQGTGTITNDDGTSLSIDDVTLAEGDAGTTPFTFTITLTQPSATAVTVDFATADGTATTADNDYAAASGSATIPAGETTTTVTVDVNGDTTAEPDETFTVDLTNPSGAPIADPQGLGTITNDDNAPPVADAGTDQSVSVVTGLAILDGSGSSDPEGAGLTYAWTLTSAPPGSTATLTAPDTVAPSLVPDAIGDYTIELVVNDGFVDSAADPVVVTATNEAPVADAGTDQSVSVATGIAILDGSGSSDADGQGLTYAWTLTSAPAGSTATLAAPDTVAPSLVPDAIGDYTIELVVNDGFVDSAADPVVVTATNQAPVADAGTDQSVSVATGIAILDGSGSSDADGQGLTYAWTLTSAPPGSTATLTAADTVAPSLVPDAIGDYTIELVVNDGFVDSAADPVVVTATNQAPVADAGTDRTVAVLTGFAILNGTGSSDADGQGLTYAWTITVAPPGSAATLTGAASSTPSLVPDQVGDYTVQLIVNDGFADSAPDTALVTATNQPPVADAGADRTVDVGTLVILNGSGSSDPDGHGLTYAWTLTAPAGSAASLTGAASFTPSFTPDVAGDYSVELIVNDGFVDSAPDTVVVSTTNQAPVADAGPDQGAFVGDDVPLDGTGSSDPDGDTITYAWTVVSGPGGSSATFSDPTAQSPTVSVTQVGSYTIGLVVNDGSLSSTQDTMVITVAPLPALSIAGVSQPEGDAGTTGFVFNVTLTPTISRAVTVGFTTANGSATAPLDFAAQSGTLTFPAGNGLQTVTVAVNGDTTPEPNETFSVSLSSPVSATIATGVATGIIQNDDAFASITLTPPVVNLLTGESATMTVTLGQAAGTGGQVVDLVSNDTGVAQVPPSVTVPEGNTTADFTVTAGITTGGALVTASATGFTSDNSTVNVSTRAMSLALDSPLVGTTRSIAGTVTLGVPAPVGGVTVNLSSRDTGIATVAPASVFIAEGDTQATFDVTGVSVGAATITASAAGYTNATDSITVTSAVINIGAVPVLAPGQTLSVPVSLTEAAPTGGLTVSFAVADTSIATMDTSVFIPAGSQIPAANPQITGVLIGATQVTATGAGFAPDTRDVIVTIALGLAPDPRTVVEGDTQNVTLSLSAPAPAGGLVVSTSTDDTGVATVDPTITVPQGQTSVQVPVTGVAPGTTTLRASAPGVAEVTSVVNVTVAPPITIGDILIGKDLEANIGGSLGAPAPAGNLVVTITTDDPSRLLLGDTVSSPGTTSITRTVTAGGTSIAGFYLQALDGTGTATFSATAPGYAPDSSTVTFVPSGFYISTPTATFSTNTLAAPTAVTIRSARLQEGTLNYSTVQNLRAGLTVDVPVASTDPSVGTITVSPVSFPGGVSTASTGFTPTGEGTADISITQPAGFSVVANLNTTVTGTVTAPGITLGNFTVGKDLQASAGVNLEEIPLGPVNVTVTIAAAGVAQLSDNATAAGGASVTFVGVTTRAVGTVWVQGLTEGNTDITTTATGFANDTSTVDVVPSGFYISTPTATFNTNTLAGTTSVTIRSARLQQGTLNYSTVQNLRGGLTVNVPVTSSDTSVGTITVSPVAAGGNTSSWSTAFNPVGEGTADISITQPAGFSVVANLNTTVTGTVTAPGITLGNFTVGKDLQASANVSLEDTPLSPVDVTVTVNDPSVALVSMSATTGGSPSVTFPGVAGTSVGTVYVQGLAEGNTTLTTTASSTFTADMSTVDVLPSGFYISTPAATFTTNPFADPVTVTIRSARLQQGSLNYSTVQNIRAGLTVDVPVTSSDPSVGTITVSPVAAGGNTSSWSTTFDPVTLGTTDISITQPAGFSVVANLNTTVTGTVTAPNINLSNFTVGKDLQASAGVSLENAPPSPVDVTVTVASASIALVSDSATAVGSDTITFSGVSGTSVGTVWVQGLAEGSTLITVQAAGYNDDTSDVTVDPSGFYLNTSDFTTTDASSNTTISIRSARLQQGTLNYSTVQNMRAGLTVDVPVTSSDTSVGVITVSPVAAGGNTSSWSTAFDPLSAGATDIVITQPAGFFPPSNLNTTITATVTATPP